MNERNLSPQTMFTRLAADHVPRQRFFPGRTDFASWKKQAKATALACLGETPARVPLRPEQTAEWKDRGVLKRRYLIDVGPEISAVLQVNLPDAATGQLPAIMCWHGHGAFGKEPVMGNLGELEIAEAIQCHHYDYGHQMAEAGYLTYAIDWIGCGDRNDSAKPHFLSTAGGRDWCNLYYLHATMLGTTPLAINLSHGRAATDFVSTLPEVSPGRLGVMGLSGGGTMTLWTALTDDRFQAAEIIGYSDLWALFGIRDINYCGMQVAPGLFREVDLPDLQGLLAPLPLLIDIGANDRCFDAANALRCFRRVEEIYHAAGASDSLHLDLFAGGHAWGGNRSRAFFRKFLVEATQSVHSKPS